MIARRIAALTLVVVAVGTCVGRAGAHSEHPPSSIRVTRDIVYRSLPGWRGTLDIYRRRNARSAQPTVVYIHGGGIPKEGDQRVLIYLHGRIVEEGIRPKSDRYGYYEYQAILNTFKKAGFRVISERRNRGTDIEQYARKVADDVEGLRQSGVAPARITLVGASQGAWIAMLVSTLVKSPDVNYVIMAGCGADPAFGKLINLHGNVLSIYESSDVAGTCDSYFHDATGLQDHDEIALHTGLAHGFIYRPLREWVEPTTRWAESAHSGR
jgi:predicted esterase